MPPRRTRIYDLLDRLMDGNLESELRRLRSEEPPRPYDQIARWLATEHGVQITAEAVRQWIVNLPDPEAKASA